MVPTGARSASRCLDQLFARDVSRAKCCIAGRTSCQARKPRGQIVLSVLPHVDAVTDRDPAGTRELTLMDVIVEHEEIVGVPPDVAFGRERRPWITSARSELWASTGPDRPVTDAGERGWIRRHAHTTTPILPRFPGWRPRLRRRHSRLDRVEP